MFGTLCQSILVSEYQFFEDFEVLYSSLFDMFMICCHIFRLNGGHVVFGKVANKASRKIVRNVEGFGSKTGNPKAKISIKSCHCDAKIGQKPWKYPSQKYNYSFSYIINTVGFIQIYCTNLLHNWKRRTFNLLKLSPIKRKKHF